MLITQRNVAHRLRQSPAVTPGWRGCHSVVGPGSRRPHTAASTGDGGGRVGRPRSEGTPGPCTQPCPPRTPTPRPGGCSTTRRNCPRQHCQQTHHRTVTSYFRGQRVDLRVLVESALKSRAQLFQRTGDSG